MRSITLSVIRRNLRSYAASSSRLTYKQQPSSCLLMHHRKCLQEDPSRTPLLLRFASSSAVGNKVGDDEKLKRMLESEIERADETDDLPSPGGFPPDGFPFQIIDERGKQSITLKRDFAGENIEVKVHDSYFRDTLVMFVNISNAKRPSLQFICSFASHPETWLYAFWSFFSRFSKRPPAAARLSDEITIHSMETKNANVEESRKFSDLDKNLQKEFYEYLEVRGINSSLINFLREYMNCKDNRGYLALLKSVKEIVE